MTCGTLIEFCNEEFPIPPRLPPPPPILSYYFEDNKLNSTFYCDFCSKLDIALDPLHKQFGNSAGGTTGGLLSPSQNLTLILLIVAVVSAAVGSAITLIWRKWFRCQNGGIISKALGASHSSHSADISASPDGRRRSRTASLGSGSALQNLQKRLSSSSFISRRNIYPHNAANAISHNGSHLRSGGQSMTNNTYCECPSSMMMMCSDSSATSGVTTAATVPSPATTTSLTACTTVNPSAPSASTLSINTTGGNVYAELDPVSTQQPPQMIPVGIPGTPSAMLILPMMMNTGGGMASTPTNQYVVNHKRRQPAPLPPIPTTGDTESLVHNDASIIANNALNISNCNNSGGVLSNLIVGMNPVGVISPQQLNMGDNQMEMNDLNDIYYSDLDCKQIQF